MIVVNIGVVGANGLVGKNILKALSEYKVVIGNLVLYGSKRSAGKDVEFNGDEYKIIELSKDSIDKDLDIVFMCAGGDISREYNELFISNKTYVIDNSSVFRMVDGVPLIVPEVNLSKLNRDTYLIANPNCTTIQSCVPLGVVDDLFKLKRVTYSTYQAVSGSGIEGVNDLVNETINLYPYPIKENLIPLIDDYVSDGFSKEEHKMINETKKILSLTDLEVAATCIRVPIEVGHGVSISVEVENDLDVNKLKLAFKNDLSIALRDDTQDNIYPIASEAKGNDLVYVGRIRKDLFNDKILHFYCVADNLRKGAAGNSVQIALHLIDNII
ncbi:MAG: aspartate-semialdehyde dehydrogenase [Erysipelotrichales bacterium]